MSRSHDRTTAELPEDALDGVVGRVLTLPSCRLVCTAGPDRGRDWVVDQPVVRIGRAAEAEVPLSDATVSRVHAVLKLTPQGWSLSDAGSRHGVRLDGIRVETAYVAEGARIHLGATELTFSPSEAQIATTLSESPRLHGVLGGAPAMRELFGAVQKLAPLKVSAVITGPTGSGKGALARALHAASPRAAQPFVVLDCANLDPALMRAELFGHEKGAFTGADQARAGVFEAAHRGTLFMDEIGELPLDLQPRLLRVLEDREVQRLGSTRAAPVDVRIVAATHRDLRAQVAAGTFREDLFFRLCVVELRVPPLRDRPEDLADLAAHFLSELGAADRVPLAADVLAHLRRHAWPGNVRELRNALERATALAGAAPFTPDHFAFATPPPAPAALESAEREVIEAAFRRHAGNRTKIAAELGIALTTLRRKLRQYGLD